MEQLADSSALNPKPLTPGSHRRLLWVAGVLATLAGTLMGWQFGESSYQAVRNLWLHTLLPAFHSLHVSGLPFCS